MAIVDESMWDEKEERRKRRRRFSFSFLVENLFSLSKPALTQVHAHMHFHSHTSVSREFEKFFFVKPKILLLHSFGVRLSWGWLTNFPLLSHSTLSLSLTFAFRSPCVSQHNKWWWWCWCMQFCWLHRFYDFLPNTKWLSG